MTEFETTIEETESAADEREQVKDRVWGFLTYLLKRMIVLISFGPGIVGVVWLLGRILKR